MLNRPKFIQNVNDVDMHTKSPVDFLKLRNMLSRITTYFDEVYWPNYNERSSW